MELLSLLLTKYPMWPRSIELVEEESGSGQVVARDNVTIFVSDRGRGEVGFDEFLSPEEVEEFESAIG